MSCLFRWHLQKCPLAPGEVGDSTGRTPGRGARSPSSGKTPPLTQGFFGHLLVHRSSPTAAKTVSPSQAVLASQEGQAWADPSASPCPPAPTPDSTDRLHTRNLGPKALPGGSPAKWVSLAEPRLETLWPLSAPGLNLEPGLRQSFWEFLMDSSKGQWSSLGFPEEEDNFFK